ncbi:MAG: hypothetical protein K2H96_09115 [Muribaculaceae bacterium]|nr:hypothetical protein [Muribaculaceae bacterium]
MKKNLFIVLVFISSVLLSYAESSNGNYTSKDVELIFRQSKNTPVKHRMPGKKDVSGNYNVDLDVLYDTISQTIIVQYAGEENGEVRLYYGNTLMDYATDINCSFQIPTTGIYTIEVITENWVAEGYIDTE